MYRRGDGRQQGAELQREWPDGSYAWAWLSPGGRCIRMSGTRQGRNPWPAPPPYEATGLRCRDSYHAHVVDMPAALWLCVDRMRRRRMRTDYRRWTR